MTHITRVVVIRKPSETPPTFFQWLFGRTKRPTTQYIQAEIFNNNGVLLVPEELLEYIEPPTPDPVEEKRYNEMRRSRLPAAAENLPISR